MPTPRVRPGLPGTVQDAVVIPLWKVRLKTHPRSTQELITMGLIAFLLLGLLAGVIAKAILPGRQGAGWFLTLVLGVLGAMLGGWLGSHFLGYGLSDFFSLRTWLLAIAGAIIVFLIHGALTGRRRRL
jgi:uncharacterized membrane protein YeaQ/YmgE (transglycosylase-associated protein family)